MLSFIHLIHYVPLLRIACGTAVEIFINVLVAFMTRMARITNITQYEYVYVHRELITLIHSPTLVRTHWCAIHNATDRPDAQSPYHIRYDTGTYRGSTSKCQPFGVWSRENQSNFLTLTGEYIDWVLLCYSPDNSAYRMSCSWDTHPFSPWDAGKHMMVYIVKK